ncbi:alpha/beta hydrolase-fold protein [Streptomyces sp. Qhu-G9]|uniref:alpha/beta hydrolase n=1 Tax=Streptomyces sp. Qhu-G9 TaxID=3452799 RepID=UPI0022AC2116|nr:alpha/beta hydrolase-fold protein [Streptomyces aurantiacus]WAU82696.1 alpha/beta hydrolase-fold protein [Streptomyces aurantiacus]
MSTMWQGCLPHTNYFEMRSSGGHDYGVWVTTPPHYDPAAAPAPAVYVLDGNWAVGMTAPLIITQLDPMQSIQPYVQVSVGYAGEEAEHWERLRNRDLVPPGEPIAKEFIDAVEMEVERGVTTREQADAYLAELSNSRGDMFLNFLTDDLHPRIERDYGTAPSGHGLFGYSYGGLFSLYAWLTKSTFFESIGAGSPGIVNADSQVFARLEAMGDTLPDTKLHVTFNEQEILGDLAVYQNLTKNTATFLHRLTSRGGSVTSALMHETHVTGLQASFLSYLRTCRAQ